MRRVTIDPLTRVEGHGRVEVFLAPDGQLAEAYLVVPELRGFEHLCRGRRLEEMPALTSRICGLCPEAHHMASLKALDAMYGVTPPPAARLIRELLYAAFVVANHTTHFFALAGPDLILDEGIPASDRHLFQVLRTLGSSFAQRVLENRVANHKVIEMLGGRCINPAAGIPGGWSHGVTSEMRGRILEVAEANLSFAIDCLELYRNSVHSRLESSGRLHAPELALRIHSMGTVDDQGHLALYDGALRVVSPDGGVLQQFAAASYLEHIAERVEPWTYLKLPYLKKVGWSGLCDGDGSGVFGVGPLARLNVCDELSTPHAQRARDELFSTLSRRGPVGRWLPIHQRFATHWARLVEQLHAAERMVELATDPELTGSDLRATVPRHPVVEEGVGSVEAPRGTLIHHYRSDDRGLVTFVNLIVATTHNHAAIALSVTGAARRWIRAGSAVDEAALNQIEAAIRTHDPCLACATHSFPGSMSLVLVIRDWAGRQVAIVRR